MAGKGTASGEIISPGLPGAEAALDGVDPADWAARFRAEARGSSAFSMAVSIFLPVEADLGGWLMWRFRRRGERGRYRRARGGAAGARLWRRGGRAPRACASGSPARRA